MIPNPYLDPRLSYDITPIPEEQVLPAEIEALCQRMYLHACALCRDDVQRSDQKSISVWQLVQWGILVQDCSVYHPTYAWKLLTGDIDWLLPYAFIQMARFAGDTRACFLDRKEARGPIDQQIEDAVIFVKRHISLGAFIDGVYQEDCYELPMDSVRELISNAVCHRAYWSRSSIQVAVYDDRLEITSPGGLRPHQTKERLLAGCSCIRNRAIAAAFQFMHIIERTGSGFARVYEEVRRYGLGEPEVQNSGTSFRISIRRRRCESDQDSLPAPSAAKGEKQEQTSRLQQENDALRKRVQELECMLHQIQ